MNKKIFLFIVFFLFYIGLAFAQDNYRTGLIVKPNGDTIHGFINYKEWVKNPTSINFANSISDVKSSAVIEPADIIYFKVENEEFVSFHGQVSVDESSLKLADVPEFRAEEKIVFLKILTSGKFLTLFQYRDKLKTRFFLALRGEKPEELIYRYFMITRQSRSGLMEVTRYRTQLMTAASQTQNLSDNLKLRIKRASYSSSVLVGIADRINDKKSAPRPESVVLFIGTGVGKTNVPPATMGLESSSPSIFYSGGLDLFANRRTQKLAFRSELSLAFASFNSPENYNTFGYNTVKQRTISISTQVIYNVYNKKNLKFFISTGFRVNHATYNAFQSQPDPLSNSFIFQAGMTINRRYEITCSYIPEWGKDIGDEHFNITRVGINYHFTKRKD